MSGNSDNFYEEVEARGIRATPRVRAGAPPDAVLAGRTSARLPLAELFFGVYRVFRANVRTWLGQKKSEKRKWRKRGGLVACNLFLALSVIESFALLLFCEQEKSAAALLGGGGVE
jgi:hypothetical protein